MKRPLLSSSFKYKEQDPDYRGQPLDSDYTQDTVNERPCTDILCCLVFVVFLGLMGFIAVIGFQKGNPNLLASPFDEDQNHCKFDKGFEQYPKIYISNFVTNQSAISFVCVKQCPKIGNQTIDCHNNSIVTNCSQLKTYESTTVVNLCVPTVDVDFDFENFNASLLQEYFSDLRDAKYLVLAMFGVALVLSVLYSLLMRCFAGCFIWTFIILFIILNLVIGSVALALPEVQFLRDLLNYDSLPQNLKDRDYQIVCGSVCLAICLLTILIVCCMRREIKISIGIIKASADFVRQCCSAMLIPLYISVLQIGFISFWAVVMLYLFSSNNDLNPIHGTPFALVNWDQSVQRFTAVYVLGLFWVVFFFEGLSAYWISSTVAIWYFEQGSPDTPILRSICRSFKNLGSIAFGSLLLAIVTIIRIILEALNNKAKSATMGMDDAQAAAAKIIIKCAACIVACFERVIRFLTQNAYIMMAISGKNFCGSASESFYLMLRCTAQFAISHGTTKVFIGIGKGFILILCCVTGYIAVITFSPYKEEIYSPVFVTIVFAIASYPIITAFLGLFEMAANTLLMCYCIEIDLSKGKSKCPPGLRNFLEQYVQASSILQEAQQQQ